MTSFSKAWKWRCKNAKRHLKKKIKKENNRLNRREGKRNLQDAPVYKLDSRDVI